MADRDTAGLGLRDREDERHEEMPRDRQASRPDANDRPTEQPARRRRVRLPIVDSGPLATLRRGDLSLVRGLGRAFGVPSDCPALRTALAGRPGMTRQACLT
jgi:hypothetical protein